MGLFDRWKKKRNITPQSTPINLSVTNSQTGAWNQTTPSYGNAIVLWLNPDPEISKKGRIMMINLAKSPNTRDGRVFMWMAKECEKGEVYSEAAAWYKRAYEAGMTQAAMAQAKEGFARCKQKQDDQSAMTSFFSKDINCTISEFTNDIHYQERDLSIKSDRELLYNAPESIATNEDEKGILHWYQSRIRLLNQKQTQREGIHRHIYELRQSDVSSAKDMIIKLKNNENMLFDEINIIDKELREMEAMSIIKKLASIERETYNQNLKAQKEEDMRRYQERQRMETLKKIQEVQEREAEKRRKLREAGDTRLRKADLKNNNR